MLTKIFRILDLTEKDERLYLASLKMGPQPASIIARKSQVKRTDAYNHLKLLCDKGVFSVESRSGVMYFVPCPPEKLFDLIKVKKSLILDAENRLNLLLPLLNDHKI